MTDEKEKTPASAHSRRVPAAGRPLGTLLLAKALGLTTDEAVELRANVAAVRGQLGTMGTARMVAAEVKEGARRWLEGDT